MWYICFCPFVFQRICCFLHLFSPICCSSSINLICCISWHRCTFSVLFIKKDDPCVWSSSSDHLGRPVIIFLSNTRQTNKGLIICMCLKENYFLKFNHKGQQKGEEPLPRAHNNGQLITFCLVFNGFFPFCVVEWRPEVISYILTTSRLSAIGSWNSFCFY